MKKSFVSLVLNPELNLGHLWPLFPTIFCWIWVTKYWLSMPSFSTRIFAFSVLFPVFNSRSCELGPKTSVSQKLRPNPFVTVIKTAVCWDSSTLDCDHFPPDGFRAGSQISDTTFSQTQLLTSQVHSFQLNNVCTAIYDVLKHVLKTYPVSVLKEGFCTAFVL